MLSLKSSDEIAYNGSNNICRMDLFADTASDLTGVTTFDSIVLLAGSSALDISTGDLYRMQSDGTWILQPGTGAFANVYTKSEIDTMLGDIDSDISSLESQDTETLAAVTQLINTGGKNYAQSNTESGTLRLIIDCAAPAGDYILSIGELTSTDTDTSVCLITIYDADSNTLFSGGSTRGSDKQISVSLSAAAAKMYIYASDNYSHSSGDTVSITNLMLCPLEYWNITETYEDYCPSLTDLYQLVSAEILGLNALIGGGI